LIKRFISYYKPHKRLFILDMICAFIVALCDLVYPVIARNIINVYVPNQQLQLLITWAVVLLIIYVIKAFLNYVIQYWGHIVGVRIQGDMRAEMFDKLERLPFSYFDNNKTGSIMSRMINDLMDISELAHHGPEDAFLSVIMLVGSFIMLASINIWLCLIVFAVLPFIVLFAVKTRKGMNAAFKKSREEIAEVNSEAESAISGMRVSRAYTAREYENGKFRRSNGRFIKARSNAYKQMGIFFSGMGLFSDLLYLLVLAAGGLFFYFGIIDIGDFTAFLLYITMFLKPINRLVSLFEQIQNGMTGFERFCAVMDQPNEEDAPGAVDAGVLKGDISFKGVSFAYPLNEEQLVLKGVDIDIPQGKTVALVGESGGGKTTMCHLIPRFYEIGEGSITVDGRDIREYSRDSLRRNIGMVAQDVFLFNGTVAENIGYGKAGATMEEIEAAARAASIHEYIMTLPDGYNTGVGERGVKLSGGQKQRISIARVFLKNPPILILDEATSALDNATEREISRSLAELCKGRTCLIVAHRLSTVRNADEIIVVGRDGVKERGTHDELIEAGGVYASLHKDTLS